MPDRPQSPIGDDARQALPSQPADAGNKAFGAMVQRQRGPGRAVARGSA